MNRIAWLMVAGLLLVTAGTIGASGIAPEVTEPSGATSGSLQDIMRRQHLTAVWGHGAGRANIKPFLDDTTDFSAHIKIKVRWAQPNTSFLIQRAPELGRDVVEDSDGHCQRAFGFAPWSAADPPAPSFVTFVEVNPNGTPTGAGNIILMTDDEGRGSVEFDFHTPAAAGLTSGKQFDVVFRLIDDLANPGTLLLGECVTVTVE